MKRLLAALTLLFALAACGSDDCNTTSATQNCNKSKDQKANDVILPQDTYTDYFVNDSDGEKDGVFTIYHNVKIRNQECDVLKVYESGQVAVSTVCQPG